MWASNDTLMRQGPMTAEFYLIECKKILDASGIKDPDGKILAAMITTSSIDYAAAAISKQLSKMTDNMT